MIGIGIHTIAYELSIDMGAASLCMLRGLKNHKPCALTHDKTAPVLVKGAGSVLRVIIVIRAEGLHRREPDR